MARSSDNSTDALAARLERASHPLDSARDLDPLLDAIGDARFVLLGEASHGTSEYYTWRAELSKRLIREKEYAVHAIAGQLLQRGELIGPELDEIFAAADLSNPEMAKEFVRRPVNLPKMADLMKKEELPPGVVAVPVAASDLPGQPTPTPTPTPIPQG